MHKTNEHEFFRILSSKSRNKRNVEIDGRNFFDQPINNDIML